MYSIGVGDLGWQYGTGLKSHGKVTNWCIVRELPVNCMTVISSRWRSNMPFQRRRKCMFRWPVMGRDWVGVELSYNSVHRKFKEFGDQKSWRNYAVEKTAPSRELGPRASGWAAQENGKETLMAIRVGVNMLQFCSVGASPSDCLVSYLGHSLGKSYLSAEVQSVYSTASADWAMILETIRCQNTNKIWTQYIFS